MGKLGAAVEAVITLAARLQRVGRSRPSARPSARPLLTDRPRVPDPVAHVAAFVQPDGTTCGSATLVLARMLNDPGYAARVLDGGPDEIKARFARETVEMHRRTSRLWPMAWGTHPWASARQMSRRVGGSGVPGTRYAARFVDAKDRGRLFDAIVQAVADGHVTPVFTYDLRTAQGYSGAHSTLALGLEAGGLRVYDSWRGVVVTVGRAEFVEARLAGTLGWDRPGAAVLPAKRSIS